MKRITLIFLVIIICSGCGMFRKVFKAKHSQSVELSSKSRKDSVGLIIDKSTITIKEKIDTTITISGQVVQQDTYLNMDSLVNGMTAIKNDLIDVRLHLNPITGILSVVANLKPHKVPVKMDRETNRQNDIIQQSAQSEVSEAKLKQSSTSSTVEKEPVSIWYLIGAAAVLAVLGGIVFWIMRKS